jgi:hypothetical protein
MSEPLRPELHHRLNARFGVLIAHEGEEMSSHIEKDEGRYKLVVDNPGEYYRINCPFCSDTRGRLWINHRWGYYDQQTNSRNLWLAVCYNERCLEYAANRKKLFDLVFEDVQNGRIPGDHVNRGERLSGRVYEVKPAGLTYQLHQIDIDHPANLYLRQRGYDTVWLGRDLEVGYCLVCDPDYPMANDRIIIPIINNGVLVGWQARYIGDAPKGTPKYFTMPGMRKKEILYNLDVARKYPFVVLTEGATKVWRIGPEAVAQFGDTLSSYQAKLLATFWKTVVIYLDGNAWSRAIEAYDDLRGVPNRILVQLPEDKEPGDFDTEYNRRLIYNTAKAKGIELPGLLPK